MSCVGVGVLASYHGMDGSVDNCWMVGGEMDGAMDVLDGRVAIHSLYLQLYMYKYVPCQQ